MMTEKPLKKGVNTLALFDFDGTITTKDSLGDFILFSQGRLKTAIGGILLAPTLTAYIFRFLDNNKAKQKVLKHFFAGGLLAEIENLGAKYSRERLPKILRPAAIEKINWHKKRGHRVVIVSASSDIWLKHWAEDIGVDLIATCLDVQDGRLSGVYDGQNCHGEEKVRRIKSQLDLSDFNKIYAYGDTSGDHPMLELATHPFFKPFH